MIELSESDIKAVARDRFWSKYRWWAFGYLALMIAAVGTVFVLPNWVAVVAVAILYIAGIIWGWLAQRRWERKLVNEWKSSLQN